MKKIFFVTFAITFLALGLCLAQEKGLLLDDYEGAISGGPDGTVDFGAGNGSSVEVTKDTSIKHTGDQSLKVNYDAVSGGYMYIAKGSDLDAKNASWFIKPADIDWSNYNAISFYVYGTDSKAQIAVDLKDNGNELWRFVFTDDFKGWKPVLCLFSDFYARSDWQPDSADKNGNLDFPIKSYQFEVLPVAKGTLYFDTAELIKK